MKLKLMRFWCWVRGYHKWNMWGGVKTKKGFNLMIPVDGTRCATCKQHYEGKLKDEFDKKYHKQYGFF